MLHKVSGCSCPHNVMGLNGAVGLVQQQQNYQMPNTLKQKATEGMNVWWYLGGRSVFGCTVGEVCSDTVALHILLISLWLIRAGVIPVRATLRVSSFAFKNTTAAAFTDEFLSGCEILTSEIIQWYVWSKYVLWRPDLNPQWKTSCTHRIGTNNNTRSECSTHPQHTVAVSPVDLISGAVALLVSFRSLCEL